MIQGLHRPLINCAPRAECNCRFSVNWRDPSPERREAVRVVTTRRVRKGAQLLIDYGDSYFGGRAQLEVGGGGAEPVLG